MCGKSATLVTGIPPTILSSPGVRSAPVGATGTRNATVVAKTTADRRMTASKRSLLDAFLLLRPIAPVIVKKLPPDIVKALRNSKSISPAAIARSDRRYSTSL
jgi:hypothetical protein